MRNRTLLIGWPGANWNALHPLIDEGHLPNLSKLINNGVIGNLTSVRPTTLSSTWTSLATGKRPHDHGIVHDYEWRKNWDKIGPVSSLGRTSKALWNILSQEDFRCILAGWPASHPAEPLPNGFVVTSDFVTNKSSESISPAKTFSTLSELRIDPREITKNDLSAFVPSLSDIEDAQQTKINSLTKYIAASSTIQAVTTELLNNHEWDFAAVCFESIFHICSQFIPFTVAAKNPKSEKLHNLFGKVVTTTYAFHDLMLGVLANIAGKNTNIILISDSGIAAIDEDSKETEDFGEANYRQAGMLVFNGPSFKKDQLIYGTSILDVAPTLLHLYELPVGKDIEGKILKDTFKNIINESHIESWDKVTGKDGMHKKRFRFDPFDNDFTQIPPPSELDPGQIDILGTQIRELQFRRAESLIHAQREGMAIPILEALWSQDSLESKFSYKLMNCYIAINRTDLARKTFMKMFETKKHFADKALKAWKDLSESTKRLSIEEEAWMNRLWKQSRVNLSGMAFLQGWLLFSEKKYEECINITLKIDESKVYNKEALLMLRADCLVKINKLDAAEKQYNKIINSYQDNFDSYTALASIAYEKKKYETAVSYALLSIQIQYFNPKAHYIYGGAIYRCGKPKKAADALIVATEQNPFLIGGFQRLYLLYNGPLSDKRKAAFYKNQIELARENKGAHELKRKRAYR